MYFGKASERYAIERQNANLNYDVASIPQGSGATARNYADFYAFAIPRAAHNIKGAYTLATYLARPEIAQMIADRYNFAPVHRALYAVDVSDPFKKVAYQAALISRGWLDPSPARTDNVMQDMVESVTSGRERLRSAIMDASHELESLFR